ncbi:MAG: prenyltransferase/squalene oxidase repeat-containing protein [Verrucomicrobiales bacterium]
MKATTFITTALLGLSALTGLAQDSDKALLSLKKESLPAIAKGNAFLLSQQEEAGNIGNGETPALTALALRSILSDPSRDPAAPLGEKAQKAIDYLLSTQQEDGGFYKRGHASYNTSTAIMALLAADAEKYKPQILKARAYLVGQQAQIEGEDAQFDGGFGYGGDRRYADMSNTYMAIEALYHTRQLAHDSGAGEQPELDWQAALDFVSRAQNLQATNPLKGELKEKVGNDGGFAYYPGDSKAGEETVNGKTALRSYGSISYAGLLSLVYADLDESDPRVKAVVNWLGKNYTLDENPGMEHQGQYYYYQAMAKSLAAANLTSLKNARGEDINWRRDLAARLLNEQREDGSWINAKASRWMENDPILVTAYVTQALTQIHATLPEAE